MATRGQLSIFFKGQYFMATHTGSTVNPVLGVNILSFTAEGESIYVQDMFCLLIGCGNAWGQNSSDTTPILAKVIYFEDRRGERNWNRPCESIMRKSKKSGITDFLSMNSPVWAGQLPPWLRCCPAPESEDAVVALCGANCNLWHRGAPRVCRLWLQSGQGAHGGRTPQHGTTLDTCSQQTSSLKCLRAVRRIDFLYFNEGLLLPGCGMGP